MNSLNPNTTSFMTDLWYFELPLGFKPTYLNMDLDIYSIIIFELLLDTHWNLNSLHTIFGEHLNFQSLSLGNIDLEGSNNLVWFPNSVGNHISSKIYSHFNRNRNFIDSWH